MNSTKISILLPSRGRTDMLKSSIESLIAKADHPETIEFLLGFDNDDIESSSYFISDIAPLLEAVGATFSVLEFQRMGYENLHQYVNKLAAHAKAPWWVFWNDDAVMEDSGWDTVILSQGNKFCIQAFETHNKHPYSIFPIVPREWFEQLGYLSQHQLNDAYISQIAWMMGIMVRIPINVSHNRFDLTGKNLDATFQERKIHEGNPNNPLDFNYITQRKARYGDAEKLSVYLKNQGYDMSVWEEVKSGKRDPWALMLKADVNKHMIRF